MGIKALSIHGRTRKQMYKGEADWTLIGKIKDNPRIKIPIFGNGDIDSPQKAAAYRDRYGVDGIMIGRAAIGYPWIFREIKHYFATGQLLDPPTVEERVAAAREHLQRSIDWKGETLGILGDAAALHELLPRTAEHQAVPQGAGERVRHGGAVRDAR